VQSNLLTVVPIPYEPSTPISPYRNLLNQLTLYPSSPPPTQPSQSLKRTPPKHPHTSIIHLRYLLTRISPTLILHTLTILKHNLSKIPINRLLRRAPTPLLRLAIAVYKVVAHAGVVNCQHRLYISTHFIPSQKAYGGDSQEKGEVAGKIKRIIRGTRARIRAPIDSERRVLGCFARGEERGLRDGEEVLVRAVMEGVGLAQGE
jgi:hypothetical protein